MSAELVYSRRALADLDEIFDYIASDNPGRARSYVREIQAACQSLRRMPMKGTGRPDLGPGIRVLPLWRRIVIVYAMRSDQIEILRIFSAGQDYEAIMRSD
jgi:toxin ParE1/3/4